jgi:hypothetical protein
MLCLSALLCVDGLFSSPGCLVLEFLWSDENKRKFGRGHLNPSFDNNVALVSWDKLAGAGTCLDQSHCVVLDAWIGYHCNSKQMGFNFLFSCDRPYRVITAAPRVHERQNCGNS